MPGRSVTHSVDMQHQFTLLISSHLHSLLRLLHCSVGRCMLSVVVMGTLHRRMAELQGDGAHARQFGELAQRAQRAYVGGLWNGRYLEYDTSNSTHHDRYTYTKNTHKNTYTYAYV